MHISILLLYILKRFSNLFAIHNKTGKITVQKKAPTSAGVIELVALAQDRGIPPLRTSVHILVSLQNMFYFYFKKLYFCLNCILGSFVVKKNIYSLLILKEIFFYFKL